MQAQAASGWGRGSDWRMAVDSALEPIGALEGAATVALVYFSDRFAGAADEIRAVVRERTGARILSGSAAVGLCCDGREIMDEPGVVVLALVVPDGSVREARTSDELLGNRDGGVGIIHAGPGRVARLSGVPEFGSFLIGGLTSSRGPSVQVHADGIVEDGVTGLLLGDGIQVHAGLSQGCLPLAAGRRVTSVVNNVVLKLDERPALDVLMEDAAALVGDDPRKLGGRVFAGVSLPNRDRSEYVVRHLLAVSLDGRSVAIAGNVNHGDTIWFTRRDASAARTDMQRMLDRLSARASEPPFAGLYFSCLARGKNLFGESGVELDMIRDTLGEFPLVGFFGSGEICHHEVYGYTGVLALLYSAGS